MQAMGNMQGFKGCNRFDRFDTFIYEMDRYFSAKSQNVLSASSETNKVALISYLNNFKDIYEYCKEVYFIEEEKFINKIIAEGALPIKVCDDVIRYMNLAEEFWAVKEFYFLKNEFLLVGDYFKNGGEIYTLAELLLRIESDLGYNESDGNELIKKCVERGFIIDCGNNTFTR